MARTEENIKVIRELAKAADISEADLVAACREIVARADRPTTQAMLDTLKAFDAASEDPRDRLKRSMQSGKLPS
ncbi:MULTISPECIES: hypothetical protein [Methylobacteriaceae]|uniref:Peptidase M24 n=1 Tax=Methylorubrum populi TaxID=223967 RepID=A0A160PDL9_9HYPH|nr:MULTISPECIES: hypothetical protein [Methylobacteriaceae]MDQ0520125.1 putative heme degradation protein [Methylobacterium gregans]BAU90586.1 peptidase M24 [Methylorubrum populi]GLS52528.1 hypothetical protein GCM10007886_07110 [Methylobacterium gregans]